MKRKVIEVSSPSEAINKQAARAESIRHSHQSTLHPWWARRPLAAARADAFARLVSDPSVRAVEFSKEDEQRTELGRLDGFIERFGYWDSVRGEKLLTQAHVEILKSTGRTGVE